MALAQQVVSNRQAISTSLSSCRGTEEAHIRALITQSVSTSQFRLCAVRSKNLENDDERVRVTAILEGIRRDDVALVNTFSRLSVGPSVSAVNLGVDVPEPKFDL